MLLVKRKEQKDEKNSGAADPVADAGGPCGRRLRREGGLRPAPAGE